MYHSKKEGRTANSTYPKRQALYLLVLFLSVGSLLAKSQQRRELAFVIEIKGERNYETCSYSFIMEQMAIIKKTAQLALCGFDNQLIQLAIGLNIKNQLLRQFYHFSFFPTTSM